jgi:hypothetical protein
MPHAAFNGWTRDGMCFGNRDAAAIGLVATRLRTRQERIKANRIANCGACATGHDSSALKLLRAE